tara:strand:- start:465 stop:614 length:150 start_codon:yes stop_codon:yes gene_type:complete
MESLDPTIHSAAVHGVKPLLTLTGFAGFGAFFLCSFYCSDERDKRRRVG